MELSVIIVSYNVRYFLEQCLISVLKASEGISCEIFVVDNNSEDGSCTMVTDRFPEVKLIKNSYNAGYAKACNQALKLSAGEFVLFLNPDTIVGESTFRKCIDFMSAHEDAGAMGVKMINGNGKFLKESKRALPDPLTAFFKMTGFSKLFPSSRLFSRYYMVNIDKNETAEIEILTGAFMFIRRKVLDITGFFDENFFMYGEDIDLSYRILKEGYKIYYYPEEKIIHFKGESSKKVPINSTIYFYRAMLIFAGKHFGKKDIILFNLILKPAIYTRGVISLLEKVFIILLPLISDIIAISAGVLSSIYIIGIQKYDSVHASSLLLNFRLTAGFVLAGIISIFLAGGYKKPAGTISVLKGFGPACIIIMALYTLAGIKTDYPALSILTCCIAIMITVPLFRIILATTGYKYLKNPIITERKALIVSSKESYSRIYELLEKTEKGIKIEGRVSLLNNDSGGQTAGNIKQIKEIIRSKRIKEVIFALRDISASQLISIIEEIADFKIKTRLVLEGENVFI